MKKTMVAQIAEKLGEQNSEVLARMLDINGEQTTMLDFLFTNLCEPDVDHIGTKDALEVTAMSVGETMYIGNSTITRVK